jgi:hypothetical protein
MPLDGTGSQCPLLPSCPRLYPCTALAVKAIGQCWVKTRVAERSKSLSLRLADNVQGFARTRPGTGGWQVDMLLRYVMVVVCAAGRQSLSHLTRRLDATPVLRSRPRTPIQTGTDFGGKVRGLHVRRSSLTPVHVAKTSSKLKPLAIVLRIVKTRRWRPPVRGTPHLSPVFRS